MRRMSRYVMSNLGKQYKLNWCDTEDKPKGQASARIWVDQVTQYEVG